MRSSGVGRYHQRTPSLYRTDGQRKYLTRAECERVLAAASVLRAEQRLFLETLMATGGRVSEVLGLRGMDINANTGVVSIRTLKKRGCFQVREVPVPMQLINQLLGVFDLDGQFHDRRLWPWCRVTAWRFVAALCRRAGVRGPSASPKGFRHGFAVRAISAGIPLNLVARWLGHARIDTTAIYASVCGEEERRLAERMWEGK